MELEIGLALLLLMVLSLLATVDMAFNQLSDVGLRRLIGENGEKPESRSRQFLRQALENRPRFGFALSAMIQILLVVVAVLITSISLSLFPDPRQNEAKTDPTLGNGPILGPCRLFRGAIVFKRLSVMLHVVGYLSPDVLEFLID